MCRLRTTARNSMPALCPARNEPDTLRTSTIHGRREHTMAGRLTGKVAFLTGAGRGMGRSHAVRLAREGADVVVLDTPGELPDIRYEQPKPEDLDETVRLVEAEGRRAVAVRRDVRDLEGMRTDVDAAV